MLVLRQIVEFGFERHAGVAAIEISGDDVVAVVSQAELRKRKPGREVEPGKRLQRGNTERVIALDVEGLDRGLLPLVNIEGHINFWFLVHDLGRDLDVEISVVLIQRVDVLHAGLDQLFTVVAMREKVGFFNVDVIEYLAVGKMTIPGDRNLSDLVFMSFVDDINNVNPAGRALHVVVHFGVEVALALEKIDEVAFPFGDQVGIGGALLEYRDQLVQLAVFQERDPGQFAALNFYGYAWTEAHIEGHVSAAGIRVILNLTGTQLFDEPILSRDFLAQMSSGSFDAAGSESLTRSQ